MGATFLPMVHRLSFHTQYFTDTLPVDASNYFEEMTLNDGNLLLAYNGFHQIQQTSTWFS